MNNSVMMRKEVMERMRNMRKFLGLLSAMLLVCLPHAHAHESRSEATAVTVQSEWILPTGVTSDQVKTTRLITASAAVTELVFALGCGAQIVAVDQSGGQVPEAHGLPQLGYYAQLSAEGLLAQQPTLLLSDARIGPPAVVEQLRAAGIPILSLKSDGSTSAALERIRIVAKLLGKEATGAELVVRNEKLLEETDKLIATGAKTPRVLLLLSPGGGRMMAAGKHTAGDGLIRAVGGTNVCNEFDGYKPLTPESIVAAAPDWIIATAVDATEQEKKIRAQSALAMTPAVKQGRIITRPIMHLLTFGPHFGTAVLDVAKTIYAQGAPHE
jgi:iron complex transport system substrate-binding protein